MAIFKVPIPKGRLGIKLKDGPETGNVVKLDKIMDDSVVEGKLFENDVILGMGGTKVSSINDLLPLVQKLEGDSRYLTVERSFKDVEPEEEKEPGIDPFAIVLDENQGIEKVKLPVGSLGIRLDKYHKVMEVVPTSPLLDMIFVDDRVVSLNDTEISEMSTKQFVKFLQKQSQENRVMGIKRAPHSPRQVLVPPVETIGLVLRDSQFGWIRCLELFDNSPLKGVIFPGDRIVGANCRKVRDLRELIPLMKDKKHRVLTVVTPKNPTTGNSGSNGKKSPQKTSGVRRHMNSLKAKPVSEEKATITSFKTVGQEVFINVIAPKGKLGLKLGKNHEVKDLLSTSPLAGKLFKDDRIVSIDEVDIRGRNASSLAVLLMASQHRARALGIRRKTGKTVKVTVEERRKSSIEDANIEELEERFPNLCHFDLPLGDGAADTSTRCKILSELLSLHDTLGLPNDVETENGSFCHVIKVPKRGLDRRGELMSTLDDVMASLDSICGAETDATDLLLEFLGNRSPSSFLKHRKIAESRPKKRRRIEESKMDPNFISLKRASPDLAADSHVRIANGNKPSAKAGEGIAAENRSESQITGVGEGRVDVNTRAENNTNSGGSDGVTDSFPSKENDNASGTSVVAGVPNPLGGVIADPIVAANGGTKESRERDPQAKTANDTAAAVANPLVTNAPNKSDSKDVEMVDAATTDLASS